METIHRKPIRSVEDLEVYNLAYQAAMRIFKITKSFPPEEKYSLTDQIRRSSRSTAINIREGFAKRRYLNVFTRHCTDSLGSAEETKGWLQFACDCEYLNVSEFKELFEIYDRIKAMLHRIIESWTDFKK